MSRTLLAIIINTEQSGGRPFTTHVGYGCYIGVDITFGLRWPLTNLYIILDYCV